ncbi:MAG: hypothetical protein NTW87_37145 [Planctomycetota bacterium]|nr:hypothetical protein [Planctomycetota bacterium]
MSLLYWLLGLDNAGSIRGAVDWGCCASRALPPFCLALLIAAGLAAAALNLLPQTVMAWRTRISLTLIRLAGFALLILCRHNWSCV